MNGTEPLTKPAHGLSIVVIAIMIGVACAMVSNTLPAFLAVLAKTRGLSESQVGWAAMADMGGLTIGMLGCALLPALVQRLNWRRSIWVGLAFVITANLLSIIVSDYEPYLAVRVLAGVGAGIVIAIIYAVLAEGDGARSLAQFNVGQLACAGLATPFFTTLSDQHGIGILFAIVAGLAASTILLTGKIPRHSLATAAQGAPASEKVSIEGWLAVISVFLFFLGVGSVFAFLSFMGVAWGGEPLAIESDVGKVLFAGMSGAAVVAVVGSRFGYLWPLIIGYILFLAALALFILFKPLAAFLAIGGLFYFAVNVTMTYQFEAVTKVDSSSSAAMLVSAATLGGVAVGPAIAGYLVTPDYALVIMFGLCTASASSALMLLALRLHARKIPASGQSASDSLQSHPC
jgi:predicted MFS family arabinose efflux permease